MTSAGAQATAPSLKLLAELETTGAVKIAGAMYDLETAVVYFPPSAPRQ
jgi:hypothetical protein